jgi:hypothetical protein
MSTENKSPKVGGLKPGDKHFTKAPAKKPAAKPAPAPEPPKTGK